ncbi:MAG: histidine ammonia-lyase [Microvirga sp.]
MADAPAAGAKRRRSADLPGTSEGGPAVAVGGLIAIGDVVAVARGARVVLGPEVRGRLEAARAIVDRHAQADAAVYGLTTGLGAAVDTRLPAEEMTSFQQRAVAARAVGVGEPLGREEVRAMLFVRLAGLARGASGVSPGFAATLRDMLNAGVHPLVLRTGSLGEADLASLAQAFLPFVGAGEAECRGSRMPGPEALRLAGIAIPALGPKDAIALLNANAHTIGLAALTLHDADLAIEAMMAAGALACDGFRANLSPIDRRAVALRPAPGQAEASETLRRLLAGSDLFEPGRARRVQDPLSFRCLAPIAGAALQALAAARRAVEADLDGAGDSPAVLVQDGAMISTVNFDTTAVALAFEALGLAASHAAAAAVFRIAKLMSPGLSELPRFLTPRGGSRTGLATAQKTAAALEAEIRHLALPVGAMTAPVADGVEDYAPMTPRVVEKTRDIVRRLVRLSAIELVAAAQAVDLRTGIRLGDGTGRIHRFVRSHVAALDEDRPTGIDFERLAGAVQEGELRGVLADAGGRP